MFGLFRLLTCNIKEKFNKSRLYLRTLPKNFTSESYTEDDVIVWLYEVLRDKYYINKLGYSAPWTWECRSYEDRKEFHSKLTGRDLLINGLKRDRNSNCNIKDIEVLDGYKLPWVKENGLSDEIDLEILGAFIDACIWSLVYDFGHKLDNEDDENELVLFILDNRDKWYNFKDDISEERRQYWTDYYKEIDNDFIIKKLLSSIRSVKKDYLSEDYYLNDYLERYGRLEDSEQETADNL